MKKSAPNSEYHKAFVSQIKQIEDQLSIQQKQKEERERGVTISCTTKEFFTNNYHFRELILMRFEIPYMRSKRRGKYYLRFNRIQSAFTKKQY